MSDKAYMFPNEFMPGKVVKINPKLCDGCNLCVDRCRTQVLLPNPEKGKPPIVVYPDECWFCACCEEYCPREALRMEHALIHVGSWRKYLRLRFP